MAAVAIEPQNTKIKSHRPRPYLCIHVYRPHTPACLVFHGVVPTPMKRKLCKTQ